MRVAWRRVGTISLSSDDVAIVALRRDNVVRGHLPTQRSARLARKTDRGIHLKADGSLSCPEAFYSMIKLLRVQAATPVDGIARGVLACPPYQHPIHFDNERLA